MHKNPFDSIAFTNWATAAGLPNQTVLEPFAGANNIIKSLQDVDWCREFVSFDITPANRDVKQRDTIHSFPRGYDVCITNPPWLARNSATRRGLPFPAGRYDDVYKLCLELCLTHCKYVAALLPASFLQSGLFRERLKSYILLHQLLFAETENPVCLALFTESPNGAVEIFNDDVFIGLLEDLQAKIPSPKQSKNFRFNDPTGKLGFISFDNTSCPSIRFCQIDEIKDYPIKVSSRFITRISGDFGDVSDLIPQLNRQIDAFRKDTQDIFLTPFKGIRADGFYRRRMEFSMARKFLDAV